MISGSGRRSSGSLSARALRVGLGLMTAMAVLLSLIPYGSAEQPVTYVIDTEAILSQFTGGDLITIVTVGDAKQVVMDDPLLIIGSGIDDYEKSGINRTLEFNYFQQGHILNDSVREFMGKDLTKYNLILVGGPDHNAYTKYLMDNGYLTYNTTDKKMPAVIMEVRRSTPGNQVLVVGDAAGYPYHKKDLPFNDIIPEEYAPAAAVVTSFGLCALGIFFSKIFSQIGFFLQQLWNPVIDTVSDYANTFISDKVGDIDEKVRKVSVDEDKVEKQRKKHLLGLTTYEIIGAVVGSVLFALAFIIADQADFTLDGLLIYLIVGGVATVAHDIGHRVISYKYDVKSEYKLWGYGTLIMFVTSFLFGTVFSEPARTLIKEGDANSRKVAIVFLTGPAVSLVISLIFVPLMLAGGVLGAIGVLGFTMNFLNALYALVPFDPMDGKKIYEWNKVVWGFSFFPLLIIYFAVMILVL